MQKIDLLLSAWINQSATHDAMDWLMAAVSSPKLFAPVIVAAVIFLLIKGGFKGRVFVLLALLNLGIGDGLLNPYLRSQIRRPRPNEIVVGTRQVGWQDFRPTVEVTRQASQNPGGRSLPSGHILNNVSVGLNAAYFFPASRPFVAVWLPLMGYARVYTGAHYASDVILSTILASVYPLIILAGLNSLWFVCRHLYPSLHARHPTLWKL